MKATTESFPYPVLSNETEEWSDYPQDSYESFVKTSLKENLIEVEYDHGKAVVEIEELIKEEKAKYCLCISCADTRVRMCIYTDRKGSVENINATDFYGKVDIIPLIVVVADKVENFTSKRLNEEYNNASFSLARGDMIGIGPTYTQYILNGQLDLGSLIKFRSTDEIKGMEYGCETDGNYIVITVSEKHLRLINVLRSDNQNKPFIVMSYYKDALLRGLTALVQNKDYETSSLSWAMALSKRLQEIDEPLPEAVDFNRLNYIAQKLLAAEGVERLLKNHPLP